MCFTLVVSYSYNRRGSWRGNNSGSSNTRGRGRGNCFVCRKPDNFAADCPNQYCQSCGIWGHGMRKCTGGGLYVKAVSTYKVPEEAIIVEVNRFWSSSLCHGCKNTAQVGFKGQY